MPFAFVAAFLQVARSARFYQSKHCKNIVEILPLLLAGSFVAVSRAAVPVTDTMLLPIVTNKNENKMKSRFLIHFFRLSLIGVLLFVVVRSSFGGGWYVGNTASGEWIQYTNVWLSAGNYRFTANAGSPSAGAMLHVEVDGVTLMPAVAVVDTGRIDSFAPVHLGSASLSQGYHTLRVVFETSGVSLDWVMLRKDNDTTMAVKASDIVMVRPSTSGMLIAPIVSFNQQSEHNSVLNANDASSMFGAYPQKDALGQPYLDYQLRNWYRAPMFLDFDRRTDRYWDIMVDQLLASRAQVPLIHCRETIDFTHDLQDRGYVRGDGAFEGRWLKKFVEAVARNPQAANTLQIGMFFEDGPLADDYFKINGSYPSWGSSSLADYAMQYWLDPWFDNVPASLLYQPFPSRPIINIYTAHPGNMVQDGNMSVFLVNIRSRMIARYGLNPIFILSPDSDANAQAQAWGVAPWYLWGGSLYTSRLFTDGTRWGFSSCGSLKRIDTVWANNWDPVTNIGTPAGSDAGNPDYQSPLDTKGNSTLLNFYAQASAAGTKLIQQEGFFNIPEGSAIYASCAPGWNFPNQHLAAMRQYADPTTESLMFEAESCDSYYKTNLHENLGGSYRRQWYSTTGLDVYRPLHNLNAWTVKSSGPANLVELSAGFFDVWALDSTGRVWAHVISDGAPDTWTSVGMNGIPKFTCLSAGKHHAWAINGTAVYSCKLPYGWANQDHTTWTPQSGGMVQLSVNAADVWALDAAGLIYRRRVNELDAPGDVWTQVPGPLLDIIHTGGNFVWGISGTNIYHSLTTNISWTQVPNLENIRQISVGSEEVWGINATGNVFRRSASGVGGWDTVDGNLTKIVVGENYAWGLSGLTPSSRRLAGFLGTPAPTIPEIPTGLAAVAGAGQASLSWTASLGAAGYNVKRATAPAGPYTTVVVATTNAAIDTGLAGGTTYYYVVPAFNGVGESANSATISATMLNNPVLLSQGRPVTADSSQTGNGNIAANGNDGSLGTRWAANDNLYPHWWRTDLGTNCNLSSVTINWYGTGGRSYQYKIEVSTNDINYVKAVDQTGNTSTANTTNTFTATARYVRITVTGVVPSGGNASFYECLVYGNVVPSASLTPTSIAMIASGGTVDLSWPADHLGWHLQVQTNAPGAGLGTNWVTLPGSDVVTSTNITINPAKGAVFYRLISP
ncbi:MAG: Coagulation factor 5/8 type domain protein [Pedosphaera sp.]|nr:Coagulation factor 5/8 type domain protein [Pedosphaera sp.]